MPGQLQVGSPCRLHSISSKQGSDRGDVIGARWVGRDVKDDVFPVPGHRPVGEGAALPLGGGEGLQLLVEAGGRLVADFKAMAAASSAEPAPCRQGLPSLHPCSAVIWPQRARKGQLKDLWAVSTHSYIIPDGPQLIAGGRLSTVVRLLAASAEYDDLIVGRCRCRLLGSCP
jgi:hypothetical protein